MKIDLSLVSFLKPHVINEETYQLAHGGFTRNQLKKSDVIKSIEQHRRFKRLTKVQDDKRLDKRKAMVTTSNFPKVYMSSQMPSQLGS